MKRLVGLISFAIFGAFISKVNAFPNGAPLGACKSMTPLHSHTSDSNLGYSITLLSETPSFSPGTQVQVAILGQFRGLILQVRETIDGEAVGSWVNPGSGFKTIDCSERRNSAVTHSNRNEKTSPTFVWNSPNFCNSGFYYIRVTVVRTFSEVQEDIIQELACIPLQRSTAQPTIQTFPPPVPTQSGTDTPQSLPALLPTPAPGPTCEHSSMTVIPVGSYVTSFELPSYNGWLNTGVRMWQRNSGSTPSFFTGPSDASDGSYYAYFEASSPTQPGDRAILQTAPNLRGCFCFHFAVSYYVSNNSPNHGLTVEVGGIEVFSAEVHEDNQWTKKYIQVDSPEYVQIRIIGKRGRDWLGDMAIDNLRVVPGICR